MANLRRAVEGVDDLAVMQRAGATDEVCAQRTGSEQFVICYDVDSPGICRFDYRENLEGLGPGVEVTWMLPHGLPINQMLAVLVFTAAEFVNEFPQYIDMKLGGTFSGKQGRRSDLASEAWKRKLERVDTVVYEPRSAGTFAVMGSIRHLLDMAQ